MPARRRRPARPMAEVVKTDFHTSLRTGRRECWGARTPDGRWRMIREESPGTPWLLVHRDFDVVAEQAGTLNACREYVACGWAWEALAQRLAEAAALEAEPFTEVPCRCTWCAQGITTHPPVRVRLTT